jgi:Fe-S cluster biogenesis protein NfuA
VIFDSFKDGNLKVVLQGSCRGCPSASITLKYGIENIIKRIIPEVKNVESK